MEEGCEKGFSHQRDRDFWSEARTPKELGISGMDREQLIRYVA